MIRQRVERKMELMHGEQYFTQEMSDAFFNIGFKPPAVRERLHGVTVRYATTRDRFVVLVDLSRTHKTFGTVVSRGFMPTSEYEDRPTDMIKAMREPAALDRANRVLLASEDNYDRISAGVIFGTLAVGYLATQH